MMQLKGIVVALILGHAAAACDNDLSYLPVQISRGRPVADASRRLARPRPQREPNFVIDVVAGARVVAPPHWLISAQVAQFAGQAPVRKRRRD